MSRLDKVVHLYVRLAGSLEAVARAQDDLAIELGRTNDRITELIGCIDRLTGYKPRDAADAEPIDTVVTVIPVTEIRPSLPANVIDMTRYVASGREGVTQ